MIATVVASIALLIVLLTNAQDWHPEFAKAMIIGGAVAINGGFFLMVKDITQAVVDYSVGNGQLTLAVMR